MKHLVILAQFVLSFVLAQCVMSGAAYTKSNTGETNVYPGIPIGIYKVFFFENLIIKIQNNVFTNVFQISISNFLR